MCFDIDASPPVPAGDRPITTQQLILEAGDGNRLMAYEAAGAEPSAVAVIVLPDVRGLFTFYEQLAERFASVGHDAVAIDYFGRTAGVEHRDESFAFMDHVMETTHGGVKADVAAAVDHLRSGRADRKVFTVGFCFGGSNSWFQAANGHGLSGAVGFYGHSGRELPPGAGTVIERTVDMECPVLALQAGIDQNISGELNAAFDAALEAAGVEHEVVTYDDAPHSFFDRAQAEYAEASADAWRRVVGFIASNS